MIYSRKSIITNILLFLLLTSCGTDHSKKGRSLASVGGTFSLEMKELNSQSAQIALKICNALRSKRTTWHMPPVKGKTATFNIGSSDCDNEKSMDTISAKITPTLMSHPIILDRFKGIFFYDEVLTDTHGPMKTICPSLFSADTPLEFYADDDDRVYTQFSNIDGDSDRLTLLFAEPDSDDQQKLIGYKSYKVISYDIVTTSKSPELLGSVKVINQAEACGETNRQSTFTQSLISIL